ncbi:MAG TPA: DUF72 domain-containing protein [Verrucomicrobiae bacterium]|nr:DUF72 domain-containing protein [Verrucomicrobiae bacterium]
MPALEIGCSGFNYKHWRGVFYPDHLPQKRWLEHYCSTFSTVELNVTFYRQPLPSTFVHWHDTTPDGFGFSVKGSRYITHIKRLKDVGEALSRFFDGVAHLREKLQVVLWQFPPHFELHLDRFRDFLDLLEPYGVRNTFEFRNASWMNDRVFDLARERKVSLCTAEWPAFLMDVPVTADFVYIRRHGHGGDASGRFPLPFIRRDAERIRSLLDAGKDVYIYFNNDAAGSAIFNALELREMLSQKEEEHGVHAGNRYDLCAGGEGVHPGHRP